MDYRANITLTTNNTFNVRDEYKSLGVRKLQEICAKESFPYAVCALNVEGDLNVGVMVRTASLLGAQNFYIFGRRKVDSRSMVGAQNYLPIERIEGLNINSEPDYGKFVEFVKEKKLFPILIEQGGAELNRVDWHDVVEEAFEADATPCFVFGNEASGFPKEFLDNDYPIISIPQLGVLRSYNVAAACAIVLWAYIADRYV